MPDTNTDSRFALPDSCQPLRRFVHPTKENARSGRCSFIRVFCASINLNFSFLHLFVSVEFEIKNLVIPPKAGLPRGCLNVTELLTCLDVKRLEEAGTKSTKIQSSFSSFGRICQRSRLIYENT